MEQIIVIGGGLAGCEAAWQAAQAGIHVSLYEMRPQTTTAAHTSDLLCELVCSNSLGSLQRNRPTGLLKEECKMLGSLVVKIAEETAIPAGDALAVDRLTFSQRITHSLESHPNISIIRGEVKKIPSLPTIIATGPLTSDQMAQSIAELTGSEQLFFFDAIAPIVSLSSVDMNIAFRASRYKYENEVHGDYVNCPFSEEQYKVFIDALLSAERFPLKTFETDFIDSEKKKKGSFFEGCLPIEIMAARDPLSLSFGPMRPTGLRNPHTGQRPYAVLQLRQDNLADTLYNLVGFQTNLTYPEQKRVFQLIPGLENAEFVRFGQMHRNTYINSPDLLDATLQMRRFPHLFFAGQIAGFEGYMGNIASGLVAGINIARFVKNEELLIFSPYSMVGALHYYIANADPEHFQPMKANFGLLPKLERIPQSKQERGFCQAKRSFSTLREFMKKHTIGNYHDQNES